MVALSVILFVVVVGLFTYWFYKVEQKRRKFDQLGGPKSLPIIGNMHQLKTNPTEFTTQWRDFVKEYGHLRVFRLMLGIYPLVLVCRPEEAEPIINSTKHMDKSSDYTFLHPWLRTGLLTSTGDKWKSRRRLLTPTFHFKILHDFVGVFNDQSRVLLNKLKQRETGVVFNIFNDVTLCALDIICETAMGRSINAQQNTDSEYVKAVYRASEYIFKRIRTPWFWPNFLYNAIGPGKKFEQTLKILHGFTEKVIRERQSEFSKLHGSNKTMEMLLEEADVDDIGKKKRLAFLDMLLCATTEGKKLSFLDIREEVDTFMFEGHDTTAMATNWALHLIGSDPKVQEKIHAEMDSIFGISDRDASMDDLKEMKYLECCIKEALRLFPSVPAFGRQLTEDCKVGNLVLEKETTILILPIALHMDEKYYPDPERFDPDRFLLDNPSKRHPYAYMPFSAGPRNCIGQKFAMFEEKVMLSTILRHFHIEATQTRDEVLPVMELILRPEKGIEVKLRPRSRT